MILQWKLNILNKVSLLKAFGIYRKPLNKNLHFVTDNICMFLISNYLAVHDLDNDKTEYIELNSKVDNPTAIFSTKCKDASNSKKTEQDNTKDPATDNSQDKLVQTEYRGGSLLKMITRPYLFSYAEECKHIDKIHDGHKLVIKNIFIKKSNLGEENRRTDADNKNEKKEEVKQKDEAGIYVAKLHITRLFEDNNTSKSYMLVHAFNEPFDIVQIFIKDKENLAYTLSKNKEGDQFITVWNFKKELLLCWKQLNKKVNKFVLYPGKSDHMLMIGHQYFRSWDINFTKKMFKENSSALIAMRVEKENNFVDIEFIKGTETYLLVSATSNVIFVNQNMAYKYEEEKNSDSGSDSQDDDHNQSDNNDDEAFEDRSKMKMLGNKRSKGHDAFIKDKSDGANIAKHEFMKDKEMKFQCIAIANKYCIVGTTGGYLLLFEKSAKHQIKYLEKIRLSERYINIKNLTFNPKEDTLAITAVSPYHIEELGPTEEEGPDQPMKFSPPVASKVKDKAKKSHTFLFTHKKSINAK